MTVTALARGLFDVTSETDSEKSYVVTPGKDCSCPHHRARGAYCKHLKAVDAYRESQPTPTALERAAQVAQKLNTETLIQSLERYNDGPVAGAIRLELACRKRAEERDAELKAMFR